MRVTIDYTGHSSRKGVHEVEVTKVLFSRKDPINCCHNFSEEVFKKGLRVADEFELKAIAPLLDVPLPLIGFREKGEGTCQTSYNKKRYLSYDGTGVTVGIPQQEWLAVCLPADFLPICTGCHNPAELKIFSVSWKTDAVEFYCRDCYRKGTFYSNYPRSLMGNTEKVLCHFCLERPCDYVASSDDGVKYTSQLHACGKCMEDSKIAAKMEQYDNCGGMKKL